VKKVIIIFLTAVYLLSAIGVSANSFYCCDVLKSTSISFSADNQVDQKMPDGADGCCKTKSRIFKVKDQHYGVGSFSLLIKFFPSFIQFNLFKLNAQPYAEFYSAFNGNAPPFWQQLQIYTIHCSYRI
jgi:hypothetical protein